MFYNIKMGKCGRKRRGNGYLIILIYRGRDGVGGINGRDGNPRWESRR